jgi:ABC-type transport system involved in multi-copper enzyme maturation permease subunit
MVFHIAKKELRNNLLSARFAIGLALCLVLIPFSLLVNIDDYKERAKLYQMDRDAAEAQLKSTRVFSGLRPEIVLPPEPLSLFSRGITGQVGNRVKILLGEKPLLAEGRAATRDNPFLDAFFSIDFVDISAIVFALLALLFSYDAVTKEKESGTLGLQMSNSVGRAPLLAGKIAGILLTLLPVLLFSFLLGAVIVLFSQAVDFSGLDWTRIALVAAASLVYMTFFAFVGLLVSARSRTSVSSLVVCLFLWVFFVFLAPNLASYAAESFVRIQPRDNLIRVLADLNKAREEEIAARTKSIPDPDWQTRWYSSSGDDGYIETYGSSKSWFEWRRARAIVSEPLRLDYADKKWAPQKSYLDSLDRQARAAERIAMISPAGVLRRIASALCGTDRTAHGADMERSREYRETFIRYLKGKGVFVSFRWLTPTPPETFLTADQIVALRSGGRFRTLAQYESWQAQQKDFGAQWEVLNKIEIAGGKPDDYPFLDPSEVPRPPRRPASLRPGLEGSVAGIGLLLIEAVFLFYLGYVAFLRYDVR